MGYYNDKGFYMVDENFFQREVTFDKNGWPSTMLLPAAREFQAGAYFNTCRTEGCLVGWAYAAFGVRFSNEEWGAQGKEREHGSRSRPPDKVQCARKKLARQFALEVLARAGVKCKNRFIEGVFDAKVCKLDGPFCEKIAHAWRCVAWERGYDVQASEPGWKP